MRPHRRQPTRLPHPWDTPGKNSGVDCHFLLQCMKVKSKSEVAHSCPTTSNPMSAAYQAPPSMGFSRQEYWSGLPLALHICCLNHFFHVRLASGPLSSLSSPRKVPAMLEPTPPILHLPSPTVTSTHSLGAGYT